MRKSKETGQESKRMSWRHVYVMATTTLLRIRFYEALTAAWVAIQPDRQTDRPSPVQFGIVGI